MCYYPYKVVVFTHLVFRPEQSGQNSPLFLEGIYVVFLTHTLCHSEERTPPAAVVLTAECWELNVSFGVH